ncbi:MAG: DUF1998 domain-containing protein [Gemmatimonadota bacterium]
MARKGVGSLRRGQVVSSFGPGATIDLPDISVVIGGLDWWKGYDQERILEPRLEEKVAQALKVPRITLYAPPAEVKEPHGPMFGIPVDEFPLWFVADVEQKKGRARTRPLLHQRSLVKGEYEHERKKYPVTPVRFVQACSNGHIADIEWYEFTHSGRTSCHRPLWIDEYGTSGDLTDALVRCECGEQRALAQATRRDVLGQCKGQRPWLPKGELCGGVGGKPEMMRLLIRTASNAYFPQKLSVLSLPEAGDKIRAAVRGLWSMLKDADSVEKLAAFRSMLSAVRDGLQGIDDATAFGYIVAEREGRTPVRRPIKVDEFEALTQAAESLGEDRPDGDFYARRLALPNPQVGVLAPIERVVLVHRLREVTAQLGFTRFESVVPDVQGELDLNVRRAALAMEPTWMPAVETRGEGVFISFKKSALEEWRARPEVRARDDAFKRAFDAQRGPAERPDATYVMLHSLAHLLITAVALDCGYNTASIRERIYVGADGCGILLYTGTSDAEGTLGGLVQSGRKIGRYLRLALDLGRLCANDPVCAQRPPDSQHDDRNSLGAACHGCLLISETCCERRNEYLDRSLVVATVQNLGCEFFVEPA